MRHAQTSRELRFDLLRIIAMLAILACHFTVFMPWGLQASPGKLGFCAILADKVLGQLGVALFFFLSGWLLCDKEFQIRRVVRIVAETWCCSALVLVVALILRDQLAAISARFAALWSDEVSRQTIMLSLMPVTKGMYWYVNAYAVLLLCTPLLNRIGQDLRQTKMVITLLLVVMNLHILVPALHFYNNLAYAIFLYMLGVYLKRTDAREPLGRPAQVLLCLVCVACVAGFIYLCRIESPIAAHFGWNYNFLYGLVPWAPAYVAMTLFRWVYHSERLRFTLSRCQNLVTCFGTATFGVYLLHQQPLARAVLFDALGALCPMPAGRIQLVVESVLLVAVSYVILTLVVIIVDRLFFRALVLGLTELLSKLFEGVARRCAVWSWLE